MLESVQVPAIENVSVYRLSHDTCFNMSNFVTYLSQKVDQMDKIVRISKLIYNSSHKQVNLNLFLFYF